MARSFLAAFDPTCRGARIAPHFWGFCASRALDAEESRPVCSRAMLRFAVALLGGLVLALPASAQTASSEADGQLRLMREPHSYVDVVDAFDDDDPFDINITLGFRHVREWGAIQRERGTWTPGDTEDPNRLSRLWQNVARHEHVQSILDVGLDVGIFRDLAIYGRLPIILSDTRSLTPTSDFDPRRLIVDNDGDGMSDPDPVNGEPLPPLFSLGSGFNSPTRFGLDYIAAGLAWSIMNQNRERELPTWMLMIEGRFNVGDPLVACNGPTCRTWTRDESPSGWGFRDAAGNAGMTRGTNALRIETRSSWRTQYVEPYAGLAFQIEWPANAERFFLPAGGLAGIVNDQPPIFGELTGGVAIIPWENRADWQRFTVDLRLHGRYISEGRDYSPLYDALGTSQNRYLTEPNPEGDRSRDSSLRTVPFLGLTDVQSHAELGGHLGVEVRAARYVRFSLGATLWYVQPYLLTFTDACNPNFTVTDPNDPRKGSCRRDTIINPDHRPVLDVPGQRFRVDEQVRVDVSLSATAQF